MSGARNFEKKREDLKDRLHMAIMILCGTLQTNTRQICQVTAIKREEAKVTRSLKEAAKKGDKDVCKILARFGKGYAGFSSLKRFSNVVCIREVVSSRKAVNKIYAAKANLNSVQLQMKGQLAQVALLL